MENELKIHQKIRLEELGYDLSKDSGSVSDAILWLSKEFDLSLSHGSVSLFAMNDAAEYALLDVLIDQAKLKVLEVVHKQDVNIGNASVLPLIHSMNNLSVKHKGLHNLVFTTDMPNEVESTWIKYQDDQVYVESSEREDISPLKVYSKGNVKLLTFIEYRIDDCIITFNPKWDIRDGVIIVTSTNWGELRSRHLEFDYLKMLRTIHSDIGRQLDFSPKTDRVTFLFSSYQYYALRSFVSKNFTYCPDDRSVEGIFLNYGIIIKEDKTLR